MSNPNTFLSVVIPVYNAAPYISECLDSILKQKADFEYEIVCVNDGSKDESESILRDYASKHLNIKVISQPNGGVTKARKTGVENSIGKWITFVDADDTLPSGTLGEYSAACSDEYDIVVGEFVDRRKPEIMPVETYREKIIRCAVSPSPCAKAIRSSLFDDHIFDIPREIRYGEDLLMNVRLAFKTDKPIYFFGKIVYNYITRTASAAHTFSKTPDYEDRFNQLLLESVSEPFQSQPLYRNSVLACRINGWKTMNFMNLSTKKNRDTDFYRHTVKAISDFGYQLSWKDKIHVYGTTIPMRLLAIYFNLQPVLIWKLKCLRKRLGF